MVRIRFLNTYVDNITLTEAVEAICALSKNGRNAYVVTPNVDHIVRIERDVQFRKIYANADLVLTDGQPLVWISKLLRTPIVEKVSGSDLLPRLCAAAAEKRLTMYFIGAAKGIAHKAAENLMAKYPGLQVVGTYSPPWGFDAEETKARQVVEMVSRARPDILVVCLGTPKQERFIEKYREAMGVPVCLGLGASLDFEAGHVRRAPKWMRDCGLEWFYRLLKEPRRMFKRYLVDDLAIFPIVLKSLRKGNADENCAGSDFPG